MGKLLRQALVLFMVFVLLTVQVFATSLDELEDEQDELEEEIEANKEEIDQMDGQLDNLAVDLANLNTQMTDVQVKIDGFIIQITDKQSEIEATKQALEVAIQEEAKYQLEIAERIKVMYEYGDSGYIEVLLEADDLGDFFTRLEYLNKILKYDDVMLAKLESIQAEIGTKKASLEEEEANLEHLKAESEIEKASLVSLSEQKKFLIEQIESDKDLLLDLIAEQEIEQAILEESIKKAIEESKLKFDGELKWPLPGNYYISSYFETRVNPIYGYTERHNGLDIPAPYGTEVLSAASGIVIASRYSNSYGNVVIIDHGSGIATLYAHNSRLLVGVGEAVSRGQAIAEVGSTGWSTGNHLHFGVQSDGVWVDPLGYFN